LPAYEADFNTVTLFAAKTPTNFLLSLLPGWKALANQRLTFVSYFNQTKARKRSSDGSESWRRVL
jgi:hypothetical protein